MRFLGPAIRIIPAAILALAVGGAGHAAFAETEAAAIKLAPHRAVYDLKLTQSRNDRSLEAVSGRILYDFSGNSCEGYALEFRQVSELNNGEGKAALSDLRATTWEDGAATSFRFNSENLLNRKPVDSVDGQARRGSGSVAVNLTKPETKKFDIDAGMVFPSEHLRRIIAAARDGKTLLELPVYDGSENGQKVYNTLTVIGRPIAPEQRVPTDAAAGQAALAGLLRWPVTISYFDKVAKDGEQTPSYSITFELYENGISRALLLDYNDFVIKGDMTTLEVKDTKPCQ
ncbi:MAG: hypothetical protein QOD40_2169 [Alphaproteobacteria bacterium]|nr:hypothetical protein [Alphaproteobacteria bacterium]